MRQRWVDYWVFWREFRRAYCTTGAVLPSGRALARGLCRYVRVGGEESKFWVKETPSPRHGESPAATCSLPVGEGIEGRRILEVGPGTGAVTGEIVRRMGAGDRLVLVERNEQFVQRLRARLADEPRLAGAAERIDLRQASVEDLAEDELFDLIVSGLPLNNFSVELVEQILGKLRRLLAPGGTLSFFEYVGVRRVKSLVSGRAERERLRGVGRALAEMLGAHEIHRDLVLANVPPAWVHHVRFE